MIGSRSGPEPIPPARPTKSDPVGGTATVNSRPIGPRPGQNGLRKIRRRISVYRNPRHGGFSPRTPHSRPQTRHRGPWRFFGRLPCSSPDQGEKPPLLFPLTVIIYHVRILAQTNEISDDFEISVNAGVVRLALLFRRKQGKTGQNRRSGVFAALERGAGRGRKERRPAARTVSDFPPAAPLTGRLETAPQALPITELPPPLGVDPAFAIPGGARWMRVRMTQNGISAC